MNPFLRSYQFLRKTPRIVRHLKRNLTYVLNDENYWDEYSRTWTADTPQGKLQYLGNEWKNEETFLALLAKYAGKELTALEIGCGGGRITAHAAQQFHHVHAADISGKMLARCRLAVPGARVSFHKIDGFTLSGLADSSFDVVFSHDVFVHFSSLQVYPQLREIRRVLKPGGVALISFLDYNRGFEDFKRSSLQYWSRRWFPPHMRLHFITAEMLTRMADDLGLRIREMSQEKYLIVVFGR